MRVPGHVPEISVAHGRARRNCARWSFWGRCGSRSYLPVLRRNSPKHERVAGLLCHRVLDAGVGAGKAEAVNHER